MNYARLYLPLGLVIGMSAACFESGTGDCTPGAESCACSDDNTCDAGLSCVDGTCVGDGETGGDGDGDPAGDGDGDTATNGDGDGDTTTNGDGDAENSPPLITSFTVNGSDESSVMGEAGAIVVSVEVLDPDDNVNEVAITVDGQPLATVLAPGPYVAEYIIGGEAFNGDYEFAAVATDSEGAEAMAGPVTVTVSVTGGELMDVFDYDGGGIDNAYRAYVEPDGSELVVVGDEQVQGDYYGRIDRLIGGAWTDPSDGSVDGLRGVARLENGEYIAAGSSGNKTRLNRYSPGGALLDTTVHDWAPLDLDPSLREEPRQIQADADGNIYILGNYEVDIIAPDPFYLVKLTQDLEEVWTVWGDLDELNTNSNAMKMDVREDQVGLGGLQNFGFNNAFSWAARFDAATGDLLEEIIRDDEFSTVRDVAYDPSGALLIAGGVREDNSDWKTMLHRYGSGSWSRIGTHGGHGHVVSVGYDPFGDIVVVSKENCAGLSSGCDLQVRKHEPVDGDLLWEVSVPGNDFDCPYPPGDLVFDQFGYAYVVAPYHVASGNWWIGRIHP